MLALVLSAALCGQAGARSPQHNFEDDFDVFWRQVDADYPYFSKKATDWSCVRTTYRPQAATSENVDAFITVLEHALDELYDPHASLNVNLGSSTRLIPSGLDLWAEWRDGRAVVTQVRPGFAAERAGMRAGMEIVAVNGTAIREAVAARLGHCLRKPDPAALDWALLAVLAGRHDTPRAIAMRSAAGDTVFHPDEFRVDDAGQSGLVARRLEGNLGYIDIRHLGSTDTVAQFDQALQEFRQTRGLIIDLRNTPEGGSTNVAEPILGRLIDKAQAYQRVQPRHGKPWLARVKPRGPWAYRGPLVVLVSRWTGSMGEGMAIGLDGMHRATVVGTPMAGLNGGVFTHHLAQADINFTFPGEALMQLDGTARENFRPPVLVNFPGDAGAGVTGDPILEAGIAQLEKSAVPAKN